MVNLLKKLLRIKGRLSLLLVTTILPALAPAQSALDVSPAETGVAGSTVARSESLWYARTNPATLAGSRGRSFQAAYTPSSLGIEGYREGGMIGAAPIDDAIAAGGAVDLVGVPGYQEMTGSAIGAIMLPGKVALGCAVSLHSLAIDGYGSAAAVSVDLGALAWLTDEIRFGAAIGNVGRGRIAGVELPERLSFGFAFDLGRGLTLSLDGRHELRRSAAALLGLTFTPVRGLTLRAGASSMPGGIALGAGYQDERIIFDYGGLYIPPFGIRHVMGIGVKW